MGLHAQGTVAELAAGIWILTYLICCLRYLPNRLSFARELRVGFAISRLSSFAAKHMSDLSCDRYIARAVIALYKLASSPDSSVWSSSSFVSAFAPGTQPPLALPANPVLSIMICA